MWWDKSTVSESLESKEEDPKWDRSPAIIFTVQSQRDSEEPGQVMLTTKRYAGTSVNSATAVETEVYAQRLQNKQNISGDLTRYPFRIPVIPQSP